MEGEGLWRSVTAERRLLVVLEDIVTADQIQSLLPGMGRCLVLATGRRLSALAAAGAGLVPLTPLSDVDLIEIVADHLGSDRVDREELAARRLVRRCVGLPLAARALATRAVARPGNAIAAVESELRQSGDLMGRFDLPGCDGLWHRLGESCALLSHSAAHLYRSLGLLPMADFSVADAAVLVPALADRMPVLIEELLDSSLLEEREIGRYRFQPLVALHASWSVAQLEPPTVIRAVLRLLIDWYLATATAAEAVLTPTHHRLPRSYATEVPSLPFGRTDAVAALTWLADHQDRLRSVLLAAVAAGLYGTAWQLVDAMWPLFHRLRPYALWLECHRIGLDAARRDGCWQAVLRMLTSLGVGLRNVGQVTEAVECFREALGIAVKHGDRRMEAQAGHGLGCCQRLRGRLIDAEKQLERALDLRTAIGYDRGVALSRVALAQVRMAAGRSEEAVPMLANACAEFRRLDDAYELARTLGLQGLAEFQAGRLQEAHLTWRLAFEGAEAVRSAGGMSFVAERLGHLAEQCAQPEEALHWYGHAVANYPTGSSEWEPRHPGKVELMHRIDALERQLTGFGRTAMDLS